MRENEISLRECSDSTAQLRILEGTMVLAVEAIGRFPRRAKQCGANHV